MIPNKRTPMVYLSLLEPICMYMTIIVSLFVNILDFRRAFTGPLVLLSLCIINQSFILHTCSTLNRCDEKHSQIESTVLLARLYESTGRAIAVTPASASASASVSASALALASALLKC